MTTGQRTTTTTTAPAPAEPQILAAGDIAGCDTAGDEQTAAVIAAHPDATVLALGDLAYDRGSASDFADCYGGTWGRFRDRTRPAPGNHEYGNGRAAAYFATFPHAGRTGEGWYSFDLAGWHLIALNSNCSLVGGCGPGSPQLRWLEADLAGHAGARCTLAYWHHPRWSSGLHGSDASLEPVWHALATAGAEVVLSGHDHDYERFAPIDGIREFVVGTGGRSHYPFGNVDPRSEARDATSFGVLALTLRGDGYDWRFLPAAGATFTDRGTATCR